MSTSSLAAAVRKAHARSMVIFGACDPYVAPRPREPQLPDVERHELAPSIRPGIPEQQLRPIPRCKVVIRHCHEDRRQLLDEERLLLPHGRARARLQRRRSRRTKECSVGVSSPAVAWRLALAASRRRSVGREPDRPARETGRERLRCVSRAFK